MAWSSPQDSRTVRYDGVASMWAACFGYSASLRHLSRLTILLEVSNTVRYGWNQRDWGAHMVFIDKLRDAAENGLASGIEKTAEEMVTDTYRGIKGLLRRVFVEKPGDEAGDKEQRTLYIPPQRRTRPRAIIIK